jgi:biotin transport system substrate-specific component
MVMLWVLAGALVIAIGARVNIPLEPVPMTLQTLGVLVVAGIGGVRIGMGASALYLLLVVAGAPILSSGNAAPGRAFLDLKTAGYVVGFLPAAYACRFCGRDFLGVQFKGTRLMGALAAMLLAHAIILAIGVAWLAHHIGLESAVDRGALPFLLGALIKSILAALIVHYFVNLRSQ